MGSITEDGGSSYVYVLFEHKSYPERLISLHLLRYMVRIWEQAVWKGWGQVFLIVVMKKLGQANYVAVVLLLEK